MADRTFDFSHILLVVKVLAPLLVAAWLVMAFWTSNEQRAGSS
jgi:hypothetical protein